MVLDFEHRTVSLSVGEFAEFTLGPRAVLGGSGGLWRAQLGSRWHREFQQRTLSTHPSAIFEIPVSGNIFHRSWTIALSGRIDQIVDTGDQRIYREIKTVLRTLPTPEADLRAEHASYFIQLSTYRALTAIADSASPSDSAQTCSHARWELVFVEADTGLAQTVLLDQGDTATFNAQLDRLVQFLDSRQQARDRLRHLAFHPAFQSLRPGQEHTTTALHQAISKATGVVLFEAPTGFGKTGVILEAALSLLREGHFERLVYLTSKATGQLQVRQTLARMFAGVPAGLWVVRPKTEHCINTVFHCTHTACPFLDDLPSRWQRANLSRFALDPETPRDLASLRAAGEDARVCPYEITRVSLSSNEVWIGDLNYVFSPSHRSLFFEQPAFLAAHTLLVVDEAHNLPSRVADVFSHSFSFDSADEIRSSLATVHAPTALLLAWDQWLHFLRHCRPTERLTLADEDDALDLLKQIARALASAALDYSALAPEIADRLWQIPAFLDQFEEFPDLPRLWWCPKNTFLSITCLDAAAPIGCILREFGGAVLASATFGPETVYAAALGLDQHPPRPRPALVVAQTDSGISPSPNPQDSAPPSRFGKLTKRETKKLFSHLSNATELLRAEEAKASLVVPVRAETPWRTSAYNVACDLRIDTSFQHRERFYAQTAHTVVQFMDNVRNSPGTTGNPTLPQLTRAPIVVFFPSYNYATTIQDQLRAINPDVATSLQPRGADLATQDRWLRDSLDSAQIILLVLGSSFAEGIDLLGGCIGGAVVVGPALPEVNALQRARLAQLEPFGKNEAVRRVYQIPGMQKVNQALGRLVRAPGQTARVLLHCRRFADPVYQALLHEDFRSSISISNDTDFTRWLSTR